MALVGSLTASYALETFGRKNTCLKMALVTLLCKAALLRVHVVTFFSANRLSIGYKARLRPKL